ncbi:MAG: MBL fold metallo-hydrolase [Erythrobacter sp.]|nr:MBL fold metallo-hydrolase [Erythrobacter sp.]
MLRNTQTLVLWILLALPAIAHARSAGEIVERAQAAHGDTAAIEAEGGAVVVGTGFVDLAAMQQGRTLDEPERWPATQTIVIDSRTGTTSHINDWHNYAFSNQKFFEHHDAEGRILFGDLANGGAFWPPFLAPRGGHNRYRRYLPSLLVDEVARAGRTELVGDRAFLWRGMTVDAIDYTAENGDRLRLYFSQDSGLLAGAAASFDAELIGRSVIEFEWSGYQAAPSGMRPARLRSWLNGRLLRELDLDIRLGGVGDAMAFLSENPPGSPPEDQIAAEDMPIPARQRGAFSEVAPDVWLFPSVRPGFAMMAFEFPEFIVSVDAPAGWYELEQIPPHQIGREGDGEALTRKLIRTIREAIPDKPIRYAVMTHHHSDHIGGFRAYVDEDVTLLASKETARAIRAAHLHDPASAEPVIEIVEGERRIEAGPMSLRLMELPSGNPKAEGFLVTYAQPADVLYATSFIYPVPEAVFPLKESIILSKWYVDWLDASGLAPALHYNIHGLVQVQDWQVEAIRALPDVSAQLAE